MQIRDQLEADLHDYFSAMTGMNTQKFESECLFLIPARVSESLL